MKSILAAAALLLLGAVASAAPVVYTDEAAFVADLADLGYTVVHEGFEDDVVWADSRNSISSPGSTPAVVSQGILWTSNDPQNELATGTVGGSAPEGAFAIYSLPHGTTTDSGLYCDSAEDPDIPIECFQNDGLSIASQTGATLYAFGGRFDTANSGKLSFLLDGVDINGNDTDNIDNWQREGTLADSYSFVGVIDTDGFLSAEVRELRGKDFQQVLLFADEFTVAVVVAPACSDGTDNDGDGRIDFDGGEFVHGACSNGTCPPGVSDPNQDGVADPDPQCVGRPFRNQERARSCGLGFELVAPLGPLLVARRRHRRAIAGQSSRRYSA